MRRRKAYSSLLMSQYLLCYSESRFARRSGMPTAFWPLFVSSCLLDVPFLPARYDQLREEQISLWDAVDMHVSLPHMTSCGGTPLQDFKVQARAPGVCHLYWGWYSTFYKPQAETWEFLMSSWREGEKVLVAADIDVKQWLIIHLFERKCE